MSLMYTTTWNVLLIAAAGVGTGVLGAVLGTGGGVFLIPILVLGFGVPMHYAVATSIVTVIATSSAVASTNVERGTANMPLGMTLELATTIGAICGGMAAGWLSESILEMLFGLVLVPVAWLMWRGREGEGLEFAEGATSAQSKPARRRLLSLGATYRDEATGQEVKYDVEHLPGGMLVAAIAGSLSGLLGIGGGVFKVPALHLVCNVPIKAAAATSNFMIGVTAAASAFLYFGRGEVRPALTAASVLGVLAGSAIGSYVNRFLKGGLIRRVFAVLLVAVAVQMLVRAFD